MCGGGLEIGFGIPKPWTLAKTIEPCKEKRVEAAYSNAHAASGFALMTCE